jgi:glyoxylase-like metal-dependent hydrolase (beta-lactamase superfamily II)
MSKRRTGAGRRQRRRRFEEMSVKEMNLWHAAASAAVLWVMSISVNAQSTQIASPRLYVLDGGVLASDPARYRLTENDVQETSLSIASFLIVHPRGVLLWDAGAVADAERISRETGVEQQVVRADGNLRFVTLGPPLIDQLAAAGFAPADITHFAMSHYHWDHTADANTVAHARWIVTEIEREKMFATEPPGGTRPTTYDALESADVSIMDAHEHDVFGDGTVVIHQAPGHTEGHLVLYVELAETGGIVLSGDLYHYPEERTLNRLPTFDVDEAQTAASREAVEDLLERTGGALWIQHDLVHHRQLRLAPAYYE